MSKLTPRQLKRIELVAKITGSVKTPYEIDAVEAVNELRGKTSNVMATGSYAFVNNEETDACYRDYI